MSSKNTSQIKLLKSMSDVPGMDLPEIESFLANGKLLLRLASKDERGDPVIHPIWFYFENGKLYIMTGSDSKKAKNISRSKRVYFSVDSDGEPYRGVKGKADATRVKDNSTAARLGGAIIKKYMGTLDNDYGRGLNDEITSGESVVLELAPLFYSTWDYQKMATNRS